MRLTSCILPAILLLAAPAGAKPFTFAVFGDNRTDEYLVRQPEVFKALLKEVRARNPAFVISSGDLIRGYVYNTPLIRRMWKEYNSALELIAPIPVHNVVGNHDIWDETSGKLWDEYEGKRWYSWERENNLFIALDAETDVNAVTGEQLEWLKKLLARAGKFDNVFVAIHKPLFRPVINGKIGDWDMNLYTRPNEERVLLDLIAKSGVKMAFAGHYHRFDLDYREGILQYITGGAGSGLDEDDPVHAFYHYLWVEVDGKKVDVKVVRIDLARVHEPVNPLALPAVIEDAESDNGPNAWDAWNEKVRVEAAPMPDGKGGRGIKMTYDYSDYEWPELMLDPEPAAEFNARGARLSFDLYIPEDAALTPPQKLWVSISGKKGGYESKTIELARPGRMTVMLDLARPEWKWSNGKKGKDTREKKNVPADLKRLGPITSIQFFLNGYQRKEKGSLFIDDVRVK